MKTYVTEYFWYQEEESLEPSLLSAMLVFLCVRTHMHMCARICFWWGGFAVEEHSIMYGNWSLIWNMFTTPIWRTGLVVGKDGKMNRKFVLETAYYFHWQARQGPLIKQLLQDSTTEGYKRQAGGNFPVTFVVCELSNKHKNLPV